MIYFNCAKPPGQPEPVSAPTQVTHRTLVQSAEREVNLRKLFSVIATRVMEDRSAPQMQSRISYNPHHSWGHLVQSSTLWSCCLFGAPV